MFGPEGALLPLPLDTLNLLVILSDMGEGSSLGSFLKGARERKRLTLRAVEAATGISNAYLSQVESGKIRGPSPANLSKLAGAYEVSYGHLMNLAGHPLPGRLNSVVDPTGIAAKLGPVSSDEEQELIAYLRFLRSKRQQPRG